jgi:putative tryptophan/tyrosine transport system substrate-binding protein
MPSPPMDPVRRRQFLIAAGALTAAPLAVEAQQAGKVWRIGVLLTLNAPAEDPPQAFRQRLRELGYVEGRNLSLEWRYAEGRSDRLPDLAAELARLGVDVIVADITPAIRAAMRAAPTLPIVMSLPADAVGNGLVASLARPGGNVTGMSVMLPDISAKQIQLLKDALPKLSRVAVLWNPTIPWHKDMLKEVEVAASLLRLQLMPFAHQGPGDFEGAFAAMTKARVAALFVPADPVSNTHWARLVDLAAKNRLPTIFMLKDAVEGGALMSYGNDNAEMYRQVANYVDKILKGAKPADLPVAQPTKFEFFVNLKTAKALGITVPYTIMLRADRVIE